MSKPDNWGVTAGDKDLVQHKESTTQEEMDAVISRAANKELVVNGDHWESLHGVVMDVTLVTSLYCICAVQYQQTRVPQITVFW